ncbi:MAG: hypothetical protein AB2809_11620 [Candidatus Thiodiazotropha sp.]
MHIRCMMLLRVQMITILSIPGCAQADSNARHGEMELIERKAQLGYQMLERLNVADARRLRNNLTQLVSSSNETDIDLRLHEIDMLLAQIADLYRQRHDRKLLLKHQDKSRFLQSQEEFRSLSENLESASKDIRGDSSDLHAMKQAYLDELEQAESLADAGDYGAAISVLSKARNIIIQAITLINKNRTIEYKLEFANVAEEYEYELRRYTSQKMLLQLAIRERQPDPGKTERIEQTLAIADAFHEEAQTHAQSERYREALSSQEMAVGKLNSVLRLMGYFF